VFELVYSYAEVDISENVSSIGARVLQPPDHISEIEARSQEWAALIGRVAEGDQDALTTLYDATNRFIYGLLLRILGNTATAEEVLLDVYVQLWKQAARYDRQRGNPRAWLVTMARSRAIDRMRAEGQAAQRGAQLEEATTIAATHDAEWMVTHGEMQQLVCTALENLSPEQREVIELAFYSGMTHSEIATRLNQPIGTVKTRVRRGMIKLRELLGPVLEGDK
jgi:RNA polymerase sigma-70 factor (ECF subfamily)